MLEKETYRNWLEKLIRVVHYGLIFHSPNLKFPGHATGSEHSCLS